MSAEKAPTKKKAKPDGPPPLQIADSCGLFPLGVYIACKDMQQPISRMAFAQRFGITGRQFDQARQQLEKLGVSFDVVV